MERSDTQPTSAASQSIEKPTKTGPALPSTDQREGFLGGCSSISPGWTTLPRSSVEEGQQDGEGGVAVFAELHETAPNLCPPDLIEPQGITLLSGV